MKSRLRGWNDNGRRCWFGSGCNGVEDGEIHIDVWRLELRCLDWFRGLMNGGDGVESSASGEDG